MSRWHLVIVQQFLFNILPFIIKYMYAFGIWDYEMANGEINNKLATHAKRVKLVTC